MSKARFFGTGINTYPGAPLGGCVADRQSLRNQFLTQRFNHYGWDMAAAINATGTKRNILAGLKWLGEGVDVPLRVFSASGHGTPFLYQQRLQTVFCPVEFAWTPETCLFAAEVLAIIATWPKGRKIIIWDSCYSSWDKDDGVRAFAANPGQRLVQARSYPFRNQPDLSEQYGAFPHGEDVLQKAIQDGTIECCYIPACLTKGVLSADGETAADVALSDGSKFGAHTHQLESVWNACSPDKTMEKIVDQQRAELDADGYNQHSYAQGAQKSATFAEMFGI